MKKFLIVLSCFSLLLPLVSLSAFAESTSTVSVSLPSNPDYNASIQVNGRGDGTSANPVSAAVPVGSVFTIYAGATDGSSSRSVLLSYNGVRLSTDPDNPTVIPYSTNISFTGSLGLYYVYYVYIESPSVFDELGVSSGVDSSISYTGQVLTFLTSNTTTIVLIALSVAMFAVLPYGIRKIKQLIKGY